MVSTSETARTDTAYAPVFVLAPARSNSTVVTAMLGGHPQLYAFPELTLFRRQRVSQIIEDPPGWRGAPATTRLAGLLRALAEQHDGAQTEETISRAAQWLADRREWTTVAVLDHLLAQVAPRVGVEKSPETISQEHYLRRVVEAYPRARFIHLTRHPVPSIASMHRAWSRLNYWDIAPELFHDFCAGIWFHQHLRVTRLMEVLPPERALRVRSEDMLNAPAPTSAMVCEWLGIDAGPAALEAMLHPETVAHAGIGPDNARGGGDTGFLRSPTLRPTQLPATLDRPPAWRIDPWQWLSVVDLAARFGYAPAGSGSSETDRASVGNSA